MKPRVWIFVALMTADVVLAAAVPSLLAGCLFILGAMWFAAMAAAEFARTDEPPHDK